MFVSPSNVCAHNPGSGRREEVSRRKQLPGLEVWLGSLPKRVGACGASRAPRQHLGFKLFRSAACTASHCPCEEVADIIVTPAELSKYEPAVDLRLADGTRRAQTGTNNTQNHDKQIVLFVSFPVLAVLACGKTQCLASGDTEAQDRLYNLCANYSSRSVLGCQWRHYVARQRSSRSKIRHKPSTGMLETVSTGTRKQVLVV